MSNPLYRIEEVADLFVDGCLRDESGRLQFLSLYGRDGTLNRLLAAFQLPSTQGGLDRLTLVSPSGHPIRIEIGEPDRYSKHVGRLAPNLFGQLSQMWLYDKAISTLDRVNQSTWLLWPSASPDRELVRRDLWGMVSLLSPVPLLPTWSDVVIDLLPEVKGGGFKFEVQ